MYSAGPFLLVALFWMAFVMIALAGFMRRVAQSASDEAKRTYRPPITIGPIEPPAEDAKPLPRRRRSTAQARSEAGESGGQAQDRGRPSRPAVSRPATGSLGVGRMEGHPTEGTGQALRADDAAGVYAMPAYGMETDRGAGTAFAASTLFSEMEDIARGVVMSEVLGRPASAFAPVRPRLLRRWWV